ncbi:MAG: DUF1284 domain-containing protein [Clostridia bacterium]|nr:DUF1284 domain-containing protein [Clostridia bacterium]
MSKTINLRPHHLLCISFFKGKGYSDEFVSNMTGIVSALKENKDTPISLVSGEDDLCALCPNNQNGICITEDKSSKYDHLTLTALGIDTSSHSQILYSTLRALADERIINCGKRESICGDCQWTDLCHKQ